MANSGLRNVLIAALAVVLLASCASAALKEQAKLPGTDACLWTRTIFDWTALDDSTLLIHAPLPQDAYLVKLFAPIPDLKFRLRLGFQGGEGTPEQFCRDSGYVVAVGPIPEREPVVAVRALTQTQARQLLARAGNPVSRRAPPPNPRAAAG
jgi:Family of unknown function (DUF6491)